MANFVVADDHPFVRQGIKSFLKNTTNHDVIAECDTGPDTVQTALTLRPDGLIVDLDLPGLDGLEVVRRVHKAVPKTKIIVLTMHSSAAFVMMAFRNGASAYVLKSSDVADLGVAVEDVFNNSRFTSPHVDLMQSDDGDGDWVEPYESLTDREKEVMQLVVEGWKVEEIAKNLFITMRTAQTHRSNILRKLNLHREADLIRFAVERGLIHLGRSSGERDVLPHEDEPQSRAS